ncbi:class I SAM-dependent methyltransferase [Paenibacillus elgii]|uniref:class I SAM-dependent methyltransferase n=1 Tax=Paenibacillus elgii TaxID=189691 RepID=UPI0013D86CAB|nr:class I SAM-dependent methyltransferase [Paenibacillus elgii]
MNFQEIEKVIEEYEKINKLLSLLMEERELLLKERERISKPFPPGHYYSPLPNLEDIRSREVELFTANEMIPGIALNKEKQLNWLTKLSEFLNQVSFPESKDTNYRYYYNNAFYSHGDAIVLYSMIRKLKPKKIIEIGSGFSSAVILDTNQIFFNGSINCTFIEPYPERLLDLIEGQSVSLIQSRLENVDSEVFSELASNDILFIDSTHVSKIGSDVNTLFFNILPNLPKDVYIHIHDIFHPFEYPKEWIYEGRAWNEAYMLHTFLQYNDSFEIVFWSDYLIKYFAQDVKEKLPPLVEKPGGSIWLKKVR